MRVTDEDITQACIEASYPGCCVQPQFTAHYTHRGQLKHHDVDIRIHGDGIAVGMEIASLSQRSRSFQAYHEKEFERMALIVANKSNQIKRYLMVLNGGGFTWEDFREIQEIGAGFGVRVIRSLSHLMDECRERTLLAA